jgi:hypothetical protein
MDPSARQVLGLTSKEVVQAGTFEAGDALFIDDVDVDLTDCVALAEIGP